MDKRLGTYRKRGSIILLQIPSLSKNNNLFIAAEGSTLILTWVTMSRAETSLRTYV